MAKIYFNSVSSSLQVTLLQPLLGQRSSPHFQTSSPKMEGQKPSLEYHGLPPPKGLYHPQFEKEACGVGFIVNINGKASHKVSGLFEFLLRQGLEWYFYFSSKDIYNYDSCLTFSFIFF